MSAALSTMVDAAIAHSPADGIAVGTVHSDTAEFVCCGRRLGLRRDDVGDDAGDVVRCALRVGKIDQSPGSCSGSAARLSAACRASRSTTADSPSEHSR